MRLSKGTLVTLYMNPKWCYGNVNGRVGKIVDRFGLYYIVEIENNPAKCWLWYALRDELEVL